MDAPHRYASAGEWGAWFKDSGGYIRRNRIINGKREVQLQHRQVIAENLGRELLRTEEVHHLNGDRADNRLSNLELWSTSQPAGQRISDKVKWAVEILELYAAERLSQ